MGTFLLDRPQTITITQGNGQSTSVTLYETDTMQDVAKKINDAVANSLGQAAYTDNPNKFCTISDGTEGTSESVYQKKPVYDEDGNLTGYEVNATMLIRSAIPGKPGELYFSGDEDLLKAIGFNTIQEAKDASYSVSVGDAHSGKVIASNVKISGNIMQGVINPNLDVEFEAMAGLKSSWDESTKRYILSGGQVCQTFLHLKDTGIIFQIGANEGEDFIVQLGDSSCNALGIQPINVLARETASRAISIIDSAINKISLQRAKNWIIRKRS